MIRALALEIEGDCIPSTGQHGVIRTRMIAHLPAEAMAPIAAHPRQHVGAPENVG